MELHQRGSELVLGKGSSLREDVQALEQASQGNGHSTKLVGVKEGLDNATRSII